MRSDSDKELHPAEDKTAATSATATEIKASFRSQLTAKPHEKVGVEWAGSIPAQYGVAPRIRIGRSKWFNLLWLVPIGFVLLVTAIAVAGGLRTVPAVQDFMKTYPGMSELPSWAPVGLPA